MKKLLAKLALALVPFVLYFVWFAAFEPNNYFGLRSNAASSNGDGVLARVQSYRRAPTNALLLGDSRIARLDTKAMHAATGQTFANLAYDGANIAENIDLFYWLYASNPHIDTVVFSLSFYGFNAAKPTQNRMETVTQQLTNPAAYVFNLDANFKALSAFGHAVTRTAAAPPLTAPHVATTQDFTDENGDALPYRRDLIQFAAELYGACANFVPSMETAGGTLQNPRAVLEQMQSATAKNSAFIPDDALLQRLVLLTEFCVQHNINITFVAPPMDESVRALVCRPLCLTPITAAGLDALRTAGAATLNYEQDDAAQYPSTLFVNGFHLNSVTGLPLFTAALCKDLSA